MKLTADFHAGITLNPCWAEENRCRKSLGGQDETDSGLVLPGATSAILLQGTSSRGLEQNRSQRFSTSGGPRGSGELEVGFPLRHLTHRSPRLCFSPALQRLSGRPRKLSCYSDGHSSINCTLRLIHMTFACTQ